MICLCHSNQEMREMYARKKHLRRRPDDQKELALEVIRRLKAEYPDAGCTLDYDHAWQLLVSVRLAAQCTDARVNIVVQDLFAKYPSVAALAEAEPRTSKPSSNPAGWAAARPGHLSLYADAAGQVRLQGTYDL